MILKNVTAALIFLSALSVISGCSLNYGEKFAPEEAVPELVLKNSVFTRTEKGKITVSVKSSELEQYKTTGKTIAKDIEFNALDNNGEISTTGTCGYISADSKNNEYLLFDAIKLDDITRGIKISGEKLKWNSKTEQITGDKKSILEVSKNNATLSGKNFSGSAISETFSFNGAVKGKMQDDQ